MQTPIFIYVHILNTPHRSMTRCAAGDMSESEPVCTSSPRAAQLTQGIRPKVQRLTSRLQACLDQVKHLTPPGPGGGLDVGASTTAVVASDDCQSGLPGVQEHVSTNGLDAAALTAQRVLHNRSQDVDDLHLHEFNAVSNPLFEEKAAARPGHETIIAGQQPQQLLSQPSVSPGDSEDDSGDEATPSGWCFSPSGQNSYHIRAHSVSAAAPSHGMAQHAPEAAFDQQGAAAVDQGKDHGPLSVAAPRTPDSSQGQGEASDMLQVQSAGRASAPLSAAGLGIRAGPLGVAGPQPTSRADDSVHADVSGQAHSQASMTGGPGGSWDESSDAEVAAEDAARPTGWSFASAGPSTYNLGIPSQQPLQQQSGASSCSDALGPPDAQVTPAVAAAAATQVVPSRGMPPLLLPAASADDDDSGGAHTGWSFSPTGRGAYELGMPSRLSMPEPMAAVMPAAVSVLSSRRATPLPLPNAAGMEPADEDDDTGTAPTGWSFSPTGRGAYSLGMSTQPAEPEPVALVMPADAPERSARGVPLLVLPAAACMEPDTAAAADDDDDTGAAPTGWLFSPTGRGAYDLGMSTQPAEREQACEVEHVQAAGRAPLCVQQAGAAAVAAAGTAASWLVGSDAAEEGPEALAEEEAAPSGWSFAASGRGAYSLGIPTQRAEPQLASGGGGMPLAATQREESEEEGDEGTAPTGWSFASSGRGAYDLGIPSQQAQQSGATATAAAALIESPRWAPVAAISVPDDDDDDTGATNTGWTFSPTGRGAYDLGMSTQPAKPEPVALIMPADAPERSFCGVPLQVLPAAACMEPEAADDDDDDDTGAAHTGWSFSPTGRGAYSLGMSTQPAEPEPTPAAASAPSSHGALLPAIATAGTEPGAHDDDDNEGGALTGWSFSPAGRGAYDLGTPRRSQQASGSKEVAVAAIPASSPEGSSAVAPSTSAAATATASRGWLASTQPLAPAWVLAGSAAAAPPSESGRSSASGGSDAGAAGGWCFTPRGTGRYDVKVLHGAAAAAGAPAPPPWQQAGAADGGVGGGRGGASEQVAAAATSAAGGGHAREVGWTPPPSRIPLLHASAAAAAAAAVSKTATGPARMAGGPATATEAGMAAPAPAAPYPATGLQAVNGSSAGSPQVSAPNPISRRGLLLSSSKGAGAGVAVADIQKSSGRDASSRAAGMGVEARAAARPGAEAGPGAFRSKAGTSYMALAGFSPPGRPAAAAAAATAAPAPGPPIISKPATAAAPGPTTMSQPVPATTPGPTIMQLGQSGHAADGGTHVPPPASPRGSTSMQLGFMPPFASPRGSDYSRQVVAVAGPVAVQPAAAHVAAGAGLEWGAARVVATPPPSQGPAQSMGDILVAPKRSARSFFVGQLGQSEEVEVLDAG